MHYSNAFSKLLLLSVFAVQGLFAQTENGISGQTEIGVNDTLEYSYDVASPGDSLRWLTPRGCRIVSGQGTNSIRMWATFLAQDGKLELVKYTGDTTDTLSVDISICRPITNVEDVTINEGEEADIAGQKESLADIYLEKNGLSAGGRQLYTAHRLTVIPPDETEMTKPYLQCVTDSSIWICWKTSSSQEGFVEYGTEDLANKVEGTEEKLGIKYYWHSVHLTGLEPYTKYNYRVTSGDSTTASYSFMTAPKAGSNQHLRILVMGDHQIKSRSGYEWLLKAAKRKIEETYGKPINECVSMIMNDGDQVDMGVLQQYEQIHLYKSSFLSPYLPIMTCVGNHETYGDTGMKTYAAHFHYEDLQYKGIKSGTENYYAYQIGRILFVVLSTEHTGDAQKQWVQQVVDAVKDDPDVDFVISVCHRPIQCEQYIGDYSVWVRNEIIPILCQTPKHVLNIGAHHHLYHRGQLKEYPLYHIINGAASWNQLWGMSSEQDYDDVQKTIDYWGYQILDFDFENKEMNAKCYAIGNKDIVTDNLLIDSFHKKFGVEGPDKPTITNEFGTEKVSFPLVIKGNAYHSPSDQPLNSVQVQLSTSADFATVVFDKMRDVEDLYGSTGLPLRIPIDLNEGVDITECPVDSDLLKNGTYYVRMRYRDDNLSWSEWSDVKTFKVEGLEEGVSSVAIDKKLYAPNEPINITYKFAPVGKSAWVGIYHKGDKVGTTYSTWWKYTPSASGTMQASLSQPDEYFVVLFKDGGYTEITERIPFVVGTAPKLKTDKSHYKVGDTVRVAYSDAPGFSEDWIGVYKMGQVPGSSGVVSSSWKYVEQGKSADTLMLSTGDGTAYRLDKGYYYVGYFTRGGYFQPADSVLFSVGNEISTVSTDKQDFKPYEDILIDYADGPGTPKDWIGFYQEGKTIGEDELDGFYYTYGATEGTITVPAGEQKAGNYFVALYTNDSYTAVSNFIHITVGKAPVLTMDNSSVEDYLPFNFEDDVYWRDSINSVTVDGNQVSLDQIQLKSGQIAIPVSALSDTTTNHEMIIQSAGWQPSTTEFEFDKVALGVRSLSDEEPNVTVENHTIIVNSSSAHNHLELISANGMSLMSLNIGAGTNRIEVPSSVSGVVIVKVNGKVHSKVVM